MGWKWVVLPTADDCRAWPQNRTAYSNRKYQTAQTQMGCHRRHRKKMLRPSARTRMTYASTVLLTHRHALGWSSFWSYRGRCRRHRKKKRRCPRGQFFLLLLLLWTPKGRMCFGNKVCKRTKRSTNQRRTAVVSITNSAENVCERSSNSRMIGYTDCANFQRFGKLMKM